MWHCPFKFAFDYWALKDESGKTLQTAHDEDKDTLIPNKSEGEYLEKSTYDGCPKFNTEKSMDL